MNTLVAVAVLAMVGPVPASGSLPGAQLAPSYSAAGPLPGPARFGPGYERGEVPPVPLLDTVPEAGSGGAEDQAGRTEEPNRGPRDVGPFGSVEGQERLGSVLRDLETGRFWHASLRLREEGAGEGEESPDELLLLRARAEAGWGNWSAVGSLVARIPEGARSADVWWLRARSADEEEAWPEAAAAYARFLELSPSSDRRIPLARVRLVRSVDRDGREGETFSHLAGLSASASWLEPWVRLERAREASERGALRHTVRLMEDLEGEAARRGWSLVADAHLASGDTAGALSHYDSVVRDGGEERIVVEAHLRLGDLHLALGDSGSAREAFRAALRSQQERTAAARGLVESRGLDDGASAWIAFRALRDAGDPEAGLRALDRYFEHEGSDAAGPSLRLDRAELLLRAERAREAEEDLRNLVSSPDPAIARRALELSTRLHRLKGRGGELRAAQERLIERFPSSPVAVDVVFFRADARHDQGNRTAAARGYRRVVEMAPELGRAGLARMRLGQIHLGAGDLDAASRVFEEYLDAFPRGRRWEEAAYWASRIRTMQGRRETGRRLAERLVSEAPFSYYGILARELVSRETLPGVPEGPEPPRIGWIDEELSRIAILREVGLEEGVEALIASAKRRADSSEAALLRLALELGHRGFALEGIRLGWTVRERGRPWDRVLARAIFPFPHRELVLREATEWGLDPYLVAGLIRQESAFEPRIRSGAGAVGLMQLLPSTAREVAGRVGPGDLEPEQLEYPELNVHLGAAFLAELEERFTGRMPFVLSAYNAGPSRARRWEGSFPEADDPLRFTERIPYAETRGYVKLVTRNHALYRWLYEETADVKGGARSRLPEGP